MPNFYRGLSLFAGVAQSVEQLICNQPVAGSSPIASSSGVFIFHLPALELPGAGSRKLITAWGEVPERSKGTDCKSVGLSLRRFESSPLHQNFENRRFSKLQVTDNG